eukprot:TRINITY_DN10122_c0_g1_i1.p1 TRINITY_DN10122_c0_g1~~TRINITY_DN10122_c0_g1_i1.p1  ORF type:complete len:498 (+),score=79.27 TRINITY_DN10122_c0_g1_i1:45-1538(+)
MEKEDIPVFSPNSVGLSGLESPREEIPLSDSQVHEHSDHHQKITIVRHQNTHFLTHSDRQNHGSVVIQALARVYWRVLITFGPIVLAFILYYTPLLLSHGMLSEFAVFVLYKQVRLILMYNCMSLAVVLAIMFNFGIHAVKWGALVSIVCYALFSLGLVLGFPADLIRNYVFGFSVLGLIVLYHVYIKSIKRKQKLSVAEQSLLEMIQDGSVEDAIKGFVNFFVSSIVLWWVISPMYVSLQLWPKLFVQFCVVPLIRSGCSFYQLYIMNRHSSKYAHRRLVLPMFGNQFFDYLARSLLFNTFLITRYDLLGIVSLFSCIARVCAHATYFYRSRLLYHFSSMVKRLFFLPLKRKQVRSLVVMPQEPDNDVIKRDVKQRRYRISWWFPYRYRFTVEDCVTKAGITVLIPLIQFFLHYLYPDSLIQTHASLFGCLVTIAIQLTFELISAALCFYWSSRFENIDIPDSYSVPRTIYFVSVSIIVYLSLSYHGFIYGHSKVE